MKHRIFSFAIVALFVTLLSSCYGKHKIVVEGMPGTVILGPDNKQLAMIDNKGKVKIKMQSSISEYTIPIYYVPFLQAKAPGSNVAVPFAIDYKNHNRNFKRGLIYAGYLPGLYPLLFIMSSNCRDFNYVKPQRTNNDLIR